MSYSRYWGSFIEMDDIGGTGGRSHELEAPEQGRLRLSLILRSGDVNQIEKAVFCPTARTIREFRPLDTIRANVPGTRTHAPRRQLADGAIRFLRDSKQGYTVRPVETGQWLIAGDLLRMRRRRCERES